jgi:hypothetical protein
MKTRYCEPGGHDLPEKVGVAEPFLLDRLDGSRHGGRIEGLGDGWRLQQRQDFNLRVTIGALIGVAKAHQIGRVGAYARSREFLHDFREMRVGEA